MVHGGSVGLKRVHRAHRGSLEIKKVLWDRKSFTEARLELTDVNWDTKKNS